MADNQRMPRLDLRKDSSEIDPAHLDYIKKIERKNLARVLDLKRLKRRNILTGILLTGGVFGIYFYSMYAVKQETFLDDFDEPSKDSSTKT